ncbi:unnamed protein product [Rhizophagus irregularis]|nr:unnamed protein product [Rhizophagus irregularis]
MYKCNLCERSFSQKANLTQHYKQLHPYTQSSHTLDWIRNQKYENLLQQTPSQSLDDNIWKVFDNLNNFSQEPGIDANKEKSLSPASQILLFDNDENEVRMEEYNSIVNEEENERILDD